MTDAELAAVLRSFAKSLLFPPNSPRLRAATDRAVELLERDCDCHPTQVAAS